ncbi:hypothetical protein GCM10022278_15310 [Allohahella marinimesophila]|uniref:DUF4352 domain-containing protein n=2 Tax=Allohahella marinimesophila TaxID=1054972 RepID=A0ABP7P1E6_9GAMM
MHYTGYFKAIAVLFFAVPLLMAYGNIKFRIRIGIFVLLFLALSITTVYNMHARILPFSSFLDKYTRLSQVVEDRRVECFENYISEVSVKQVRIKLAGLLDRFFGVDDLILVELEVTNTGENTYLSSKNFGSVHVSYHWVDADGKVVADGARSAILEEVLPGQKFSSTIVAPVPEDVVDIFLMPSLVQEGCSWFYLANPDSRTSPIIAITP